MSRRDDPSSRYSSYSHDNRSDGIAHEYFGSYDDYARSRRTSPTRNSRLGTNESKEAKGKDTKEKDARGRNAKDRNAKSRTGHSPLDDRRPTFDTESRPLYDSSDDSSSQLGDVTPPPRLRRTSSAKSTATSASAATTAPSIRSAKSPRAALNQFNTNIRRSPSPPSPELSRRYIKPSGPPPLPPGWCAQFSAVHDRWYYYNRAMNKSQWEAPVYEEKKLKGILLNKADGGGRIRYDGTSNGGSSVGSNSDSGGGKDSGDAGGASGRRNGSNGKHDGHNHNGYTHHTKSGERRRKPNSLGTAGLLLSVAGGIAAGTMLAQALHGGKSRKTTTESTIRRTRSHSSFSD